MTARTVQQLFDLTGKTALVTGGSRGLGLQMAHALGEAGARIMLSSRKAADLEEAVADLQAAGIDARWIAADCAVEADIRRLASETLERMGPVDIVVNNAGAAWGAPAEDYPVEAWDKVMNLNVRGYFILSQHIAKHSMIARKSGRIINIASIAGLGGNPPEMQTIAYNTSKGAVINFTRALAAEWGRYNITVNAICPGFFPSKMTAGTLKALGEEKLAAHAPLRRLGDDEDLKGLTLLYASDAGKHITGQWLAVDGGVSVVGVSVGDRRMMFLQIRCPYPVREPARVHAGGVRGRAFRDPLRAQTRAHELVRRDPRRCLHDPAGRGHGHRRAQRQSGHGRGHDRDEDQFHAPRQGHAGRSSDGQRPADAPHEIDGLHRRHDL
jgi:NAD(P)-dependent dehydrogenase (short-subunit alcohol dehydrogenase family)